MRKARRRVLTKRQRAVAEQATKFVRPAVEAFLHRNPDLKKIAVTLDLESVANIAVCIAATTYDPEKSQPQTYFGTAIRHALFKEVFHAQKISARYIASESIRSPAPNTNNIRQQSRAMRALRMLTPYERALLEDRLIEKITLEQLSYEQGCDPRTVAKRVRDAIDKLRVIERDLP